MMTVFERRERHAIQAAEANAEQHAGRLVLVDVRSNVSGGMDAWQAAGLQTDRSTT